MNDYEQKLQGGHPVAGIVLGILGIVVALFCGILTGVVGGVVAAVLGLIAILLGVGARKYGKGMGAIICGVLAIVTAVFVTMGSVTIFKLVKEEAQKAGNAPLVEQAFDNPYMGILGVAGKLAASDVDPEELGNQLNALTESLGGVAAAAAGAAAGTAGN